MSGRIRSIKPEILDDEVAVALSDSAWRLWVSLRCLADDHGNARAGDRYLAANVWQDTSYVVAPVLAELIASGKVTPYSADGQRYVHLTGWETEQRIDNAGKPRVPTPAENDGEWNQELAGGFAATLGDSRKSSARASGARAVRRPDHDPDHRTTITEQRPLLPAAVAAPAGSPEPSITDPPTSTKPETIPFALSEPGPSTAKSPEAEVFDYWVTGWKRIVKGGRVPTLDQKRRGKIRARLAEKYTVADLKRAVDGLWASTWHVENKRHDIELVCRDAAHVDRFLAEADQSAPSASGTSIPVPKKVYGPPAPPPPGALEKLKELLAPPPLPTPASQVTFAGGKQAG